MKPLDLISLDAGNAQIKAVTMENEIFFPHALRRLSTSDIEDLTLRSDADSKDIFIVNGTYYAIGRQALRTGAGSVLLGEARYVETYYGVLAAIAMFRAFNESKKSVYLYGSHTPKDAIYRHDLVLAAKGNWVVENMGNRKTFRVVDARGVDEPVAAFRHATMREDDPRYYRGDFRLRKGETAILDIGGFTFAITVADKAVIDYNSSRTYPNAGILDVLDNLKASIRSNHRTRLKGANDLPETRLREALKTGVYDAGGLGRLNVQREVQEACNLLLNDILNFFQNYGGSSSFDALLLAGGGSVIMERALMESLNHRYTFMAEEDRKRMHMATARGGMKMLRLMETQGKL